MRGGPPAWGLDEVLTTPLCKGERCAQGVGGEA